MTGLRFEGRDRAAFLPEANALIVADFHLGRSRARRLRTAIDDVVDFSSRLQELLAHFEADRLIVAGDLLDDFDTIPPGVPDRFEALRAAVDATGAAFRVLRGNHDTMLASLYEDDIADMATLGDVVVCHGHEMPAERGEAYVIGHEHPAIRIAGVKRPCFLHGRGVFEGADVLILPSFSPLVRGTLFNNRARAECVSPIVRETDIGRYRPIVPEAETGEVLTFPPLGRLREFL